MRSLPRYILKISSVYLLLCAGYYFFQQYFFFHPVQLPAAHRFSWQVPFTEGYLFTAADCRINYVQFKPAEAVTAGTVVLYFHGNRNNMERYASYAADFTKNNYECWMIDYPGYGKSTGALNQVNMEAAALALYQMAARQFPAARIIIYGKSLGTGPASWLATQQPCKALLLETPYSSMHSMASRYLSFLPLKWLTKTDFTPASYCKSVTAPISIFMGLRDEVIPFTEALKLRGCLKAGDQFVCIPGYRHNNLSESDLYQAALQQALR